MVVTEKEPGEPTEKMVPAAVVIDGASSIVRVNAWTADVPTPFEAMTWIE